jgi:membrane fusion protein (multidrug efflux system)
VEHSLKSFIQSKLFGYSFSIVITILIWPLVTFAAGLATPVFVTVVDKQFFADEIEALGTLVANENVLLASSVTERVTRINFNDGQRVEKGDVLIEMDMAEETARLKEERSRFAEAQRQVDRLKPLVAKGMTSKAAADTANLVLQTSIARIPAIQAQIDERRITAPFSGKLGLRNISVGSMAQPGTLITTIDDDSVMKLDFSVPDIFVSALKEGVAIEAETKAYPNQTFKGTLSSVDSRIDPITRSILVRTLLDNTDGLLKPGMLMRVKMQQNPRQALVLPEEALVPKGDKNYVYIVIQQGDIAVVKFQSVVLGTRRKGEVEVLSNLKEGDVVVTHGTLRLQNGSAVEVKAIDTGEESVKVMLEQQSTQGP